MPARSICWMTTVSSVFCLQIYIYTHRIHVCYIGNIYHQYTPNVSIYTIHGSYGIYIKLQGSWCSLLPCKALQSNCCDPSLGGENLSAKLTNMTREFNKWCQANKIRPDVLKRMYDDLFDMLLLLHGIVFKTRWHDVGLKQNIVYILVTWCATGDPW